NLSRYSLLFPEKRDFFLENSGIFQFGVPNATLNTGTTGQSIFTLLNPRPNAIRNDLMQFFSRTIGLSDSGDALPILGGSRLTGKDLAARMAMQYLDKVWQFSGTYTVIQKNYHNEMGCIPRVGIQRFASVAAYTWRPQRWRSFLRDMRPHWQVDYVLDATGRIQTKYSDFHHQIDFQNGAEIELGRNPSYEYLAQPFKISNVAVTPRDYKFNEYFILGNTDLSRRLSANGRFSTGRFYSGYKHSYLGGAAFRFNYKLTTSVQYTRNNISLVEGRVKQDLLAARVNYGFTTTMFLNALIQYNSDSRQWSSNVRFNIIHRPLSDIFIVYNERRDSITGNLVDRALIGKVT